MATTQITNGSQLQLGKLYGISLFAKGDELSVTDVISSTATDTAIGTSLFFVKTLAAVKNSADDGSEEINGVELPLPDGETRVEATVCVDQADWANLREYNAFSCNRAYVYLSNGKVGYIPDGDTPVNALGLPLNQVRIPKHPIFADGATSAVFKIRFNIESSLLDGLTYGDFDAPVQLLG